MEIIDRTTQGIVPKNGSYGFATLSVRTGYWILSKKACLIFGIKVGDCIHFVTEPDRLYFYCDKDSITGMNLLQSTKGYDGVRLNGRTLFDVMRKRYPVVIKENAKFSLRESVTSLNGNKLIEVLIHKRL